MTTDLRGKLRPQIENIESCAKDVKKAIALAKATSDQKEQEFQEQERRLATKHRKQFSIFASRARQEHITRIEEKQMKLLHSLSTYAYQKNFYQTRKKRHVNTATWLFSTPEFANWKDGRTSSVFILTGKSKFPASILKPY